MHRYGVCDFGCVSKKIPHNILTHRTHEYAEERLDEMKKCILVVVVAAQAMLTVQAATHEKVQLWEGGPYWATTNIGAENPEDYGLYFWWGDTEGHRPSADGTSNFNFSFDNSAIYTYGKSISELQSAGWLTGKGVLAPAHDAAHVKWGSAWRMPTKQELSDLCNKCDWTWTKMNDVTGYIVRGRSAYARNSIFLPFAGRNCSVCNAGFYWSSVPFLESHAYQLQLSWVRHNVQSHAGRYDGSSIRPVQGFGEATDYVIHFNANGGVFKDKDGNVLKDANGNAATEFDQHFTYGESKPLFTDELTPMRMDGNGNEFLGWSKGTPNISSSDQLIASGREWTWDDDETEVTFYAVWTTTLTVHFFNSESDTMSPSSLSDHLRWSVDDGSTGGRKTLKCGESIEVCPGLRTVKFHVDDSYHWIAGRFKVDGVMVDDFKMNIDNDYTDAFSGSTPSRKSRSLYVKVEPSSGEANTVGVRFLCSSEIRESLRDRIKAEDVPFDPSKVRIAIGRADYNASGFLVPLMAYSMTGLEAYKTYYLPKGYYYVKYEDVIYDVDTNGGEPYWGVVLVSSFEGQLFELSNEDDEVVKKITLRFDMFGGRNAVRVEFDPQEGECQKSEMWFTYQEGNYQPGARIDKTLPKPEKDGFEFAGWFTAKSGGQWKKWGSDITDCTLFAHWTEMNREWMEENARALFPDLADLDIATVANTMSANGCKTVGECYALGIDPEDPDDDFRITSFEMKDGKPAITLNHTEDGSGNSFLPRVKTLGAKSLGASAQGAKSPSTAAQWDDVTDVADPDAAGYRFFKVTVEIP